MPAVFARDTICRLVAVCMHDEADWDRPASDREWLDLVRAASFHGVRPLLWAGIEDEDPPRDARAQLTTFARYNRFVAGLLQEQERRVTEALDATGVRYRLLKGSTVVTRCYATPAARETGDIDLLIAAGSLDRVDRALRDVGYIPWMMPEAAFGRSKELLYRIREKDPCPVWVDVHQRLFSAVTDDPLTAALLAGEQEPEASFVHVAGHAAAHRLARLKHLVDLHSLARQPDGLRWDRVRALVEGTALAPGIDLGLRWLEELAPGTATEYVRYEPLLSRPARGMRRLLAGADVWDHLAAGPTLRGFRGIAVGMLMVRGLAPRLRQLRRSLLPDRVELRQSHGHDATEPVARIWLRRVAGKLAERLGQEAR